MRVEFINPFIAAAQNVFHTMLDSELVRGSLLLKDDHALMHEVSGLIGLSGRCRGMVMVSVGRDAALNIAGVLLGSTPELLDDDVMDAIGEITNMIAGAAKTQLEEYQLSIGLPTVICGQRQSIRFPPGVMPIVVPFDSNLGSICIEVGLVESPVSEFTVNAKVKTCQLLG